MEKCFDAHSCIAPKLSARIAELETALGRAIEMAEGEELREISKIVYWQLVQVGSVAFGDIERLMKALDLPNNPEEVTRAEAES